MESPFVCENIMDMLNKHLVKDLSNIIYDYMYYPVDKFSMEFFDQCWKNNDYQFINTNGLTLLAWAMQQMCVFYNLGGYEYGKLIQKQIVELVANTKYKHVKHLNVFTSQAYNKCSVFSNICFEESTALINIRGLKHVTEKHYTYLPLLYKGKVEDLILSTEGWEEKYCRNKKEIEYMKKIGAIK